MLRTFNKYLRRCIFNRSILPFLAKMKRVVGLQPYGITVVEGMWREKFGDKVMNRLILKLAGPFSLAWQVLLLVNIIAYS